MSLRHQIRRATRAVQRKLRNRRLGQAASLGQLDDLSGGCLVVHARHLRTGQVLSHGADRPCKLASIVKVPLAVHVLWLVEEGKIELSDLVVIEPQHVCPGSGLIARHVRVPGLSLSIENLLRLSLIDSDNTATDALFDAVGGPAVVQEAVRSWGHSDIRVDRSIREMIGDLYGTQIEPGHDPKTVLRGAAPSREHARAFMGDPLDTATPRAVVGLFADVWGGRLLPPHATEWLTRVLGDCSTGNRRFRAGLPAGAVGAQKTGTLSGGTGRMVADAAVVRLPSGDHAAVAAFLTGSQQPKAEQENVLARAATVVFEALSENG